MSFCDSPLSLSDSLSLPFYLFVVIWVFANSWVNGYKGSEGTKEARVFANSWVNGYKGSTLVVATAGSKQSATITDFQSVLRRLQSELMALMKKANDSYYVFCQWFYSCSCSRNYDSIMVSGQECSYCCSWRDSNRLQRFEHPAKDYGSLSFLVVGDWGRRGLHNQSAVALQPIVTLSFVRKSRVSYGCILGFKITTICSDYVKAVCVVVIYASCRSQTNSERASNVYNIGEKEQRCLSTLRYVKSFSRQYASKVAI